jgi:16S rRNA (cytidine1402-2'-O)-methyltransferase
VATLYVVATPVGNLNDMTPRALETLRAVSLIAAEDTRVTSKLTRHFGIRTPLTSYHRHNEESKARWIADRMLEENIDVALTADAGTPGISDPGYRLVTLCSEYNISIIAVPGVSSLTAALSVCGFHIPEFAFYGFLPREKKSLKEKLIAISQSVPVAVVFESPFRVVHMIEILHEVLPDTRVCLCCDLTKRFELTIRGSASQILQALRDNPKAEKGEYCAVLDFHDIQAPEPKNAAADSLEALLVKQMLTGLTLHEAQCSLAAEGNKKNEVYQAALRLKGLFSG